MLLQTCVRKFCRPLRNKTSLEITFSNASQCAPLPVGPIRRHVWRFVLWLCGVALWCHDGMMGWPKQIKSSWQSCNQVGVIYCISDIVRILLTSNKVVPRFTSITHCINQRKSFEKRVQQMISYNSYTAVVLQITDSITRPSVQLIVELYFFSTFQIFLVSTQGASNTVLHQLSSCYS